MDSILHFKEFQANCGKGVLGAVQARNTELVDFFLRKGATVQEWMLHSARDESMLEYLEKVCSEPSMRAHITLAVRQNNLQKVKHLCKSKQDKNFALCQAVELWKNLVPTLIELGADDWNSALQAAAHDGDRQLIDFFIQKGANDWNHALANSVVGYAFTGLFNWKEPPGENLIEFFIKKGCQ